MSRLSVVVAAAIGVMVGLSAATAAATASRARVTVRTRTLVTTRHYIWTFAQDGGRVAWIGRQRHQCGLHVRTIRTGQTATTRLSTFDCDQFSEAIRLALAGRTAAWLTGYLCSNTECTWKVASAAAGDRRARLVESGEFPCGADPCGIPRSAPLLAGAGRVLVYSDGSGLVERIRGGGAHTLFRSPGSMYGLAVGNGLIATSLESLDLGDTCGCLDLPVWSPDGGKIAYLQGTFSLGGSTASVAVMNADGSGRHTITAPSGLAGDVALSLSWSPDGTKIAYDTPSSGGKIAVAKADGSGSVELTSGTSPAWSPDGTKIAFTRVDYSNNTAGIFVVDPDGTNVQNLASFGPPSGLNSPPGLGEVAWSPNGTRIAFSLGGVLQVMNADGSNVHELGPAVAGNEPAWSPDGSQIVFLNASGLAVIGADGSGLHQLTSGPDEHPSWSPDGKTIVFASDRINPYYDGGNYSPTKYLELYLVDPDGSDLRPLSFTQPARWLDTLAIHSSSGKPVAATTTTELGFGLPVIAGNVVAVGDTPSGVDQITLFDAHTGAQLGAVQVGEGSGYITLVGADAHWIAFRIGNVISALNVGTHQVIRLATVPADTIFVTVSGRRVAWAENINGRGRIRALELPS